MTEQRSGGNLIDSLVLNPVQREAVLYQDGPQLVFAGAGTGKTRVLTAKIAYLIRQIGIAPSAIFAATFTNKAAREMRERIQALIGMPCEGLWIGTFHSMCARILRREGRHLGFENSFSIYDADDQSSLMKKVMKELDIDERTMLPSAALNTISSYKNACRTPDEVTRDAAGYYDQQMARVYRTYQDALKRQQAMDFDDLITNTVLVLRNNESVRSWYQQAFSWVLVDEYQDTNLSQFHLVKLLAQQHGRVFAVGDDDQSIYGWRGAQVENILSFDQVFTGTRVFKLEQNYRSTPQILAFANAAIAPNTRRAEKKLWTASAGGESVLVTNYADDRLEASGICDRMTHLMSRQGAKPQDMFILFRTNAQSRSFEDALRKRKIPYVLIGGMSFYQRKEIKDCIAYLRLVVNPLDDVCFERIMNVPARGLGDKALEGLRASSRSSGVSLLQTVLAAPAAAGRSAKGISELKELYTALGAMQSSGADPQSLFKEMLTRSGYLTVLEGEEGEDSEARIDNINEFGSLIAEWSEDNPDKGLTAFLEEISLVSEVDKLDDKDGRVSLMTMHSGKGLEAKYVFIAGLEEGIVPSRPSFEDDRKIEEERRLFYVAATRAMKELRVSHVNQRWRFGSIVPMQPSRFLNAIAAELYSEAETGPVYEYEAPVVHQKPAFGGSGGYSRPGAPVRSSAPVQAPRPRSAPVFDDISQDIVQYRMGQAVSHKTYGPGKILQVSGFGDDLRLLVVFNDGARRKLIAKFANLEML